MSTIERQETPRRQETTRRGASPSASGAESLSQRVESLRLPPQVVAEHRAARWVPWIVAAACVAAAAALGYRQWASRGADSPGAASEATGAKGAATSPAPRAPSDIAHEAKGYIVPRRQILVSPKISGMVVELNVEEGRFVRQGEVLARLEDIEYGADVERAKAALAAAEHTLEELRNGSRDEEKKRAAAELAEGEAQLAYQYDVLRRAKELVERKVVSQEQFDDASSRYQVAMSRVESLRQAARLVEIGPREERIRAAEADVQRAKAELRKAEWRLENCTILAPISGTILKKNAEEGNIVNPIAFNGSFSLCEMADLTDLEVDVSVQERDIHKISPGQRCRIRSEAYPDEVYQGRVSRLMPIADRAKGAVSVRVKVEIPPELAGTDRMHLKPEMSALVTFLKSETTP